MVAYESSMKLQKFLGTPNLSAMHKGDDAGWGIAESLHVQVTDALRCWLEKQEYISVSLDEATDNSRMQWCCMHVYGVSSTWERESRLLGFKQVIGSATAENITSIGLKALCSLMSPEKAMRMLVMIACDGASVMQGDKSGVVKRYETDHAVAGDGDGDGDGDDVPMFHDCTEDI
jgi:hypothetical protein